MWRVDGESDSEDELPEDHEDYLDQNCARVSWLRSGPQMESLDTLMVVDRPHIAGDVVASADAPLGQVDPPTLFSPHDTLALSVHPQYCRSTAMVLPWYCRSTLGSLAAANVPHSDVLPKPVICSSG